MVSTSSPDGPGAADAPGSTDGPAGGGPSRGAGRYQRSTSGMVGALIVTLLVILAFVGFRALNRSDLDVKPERVDYLAQVGYAQQAGSEVVYPARLPRGWYATHITVSPGEPPELTLSMLTGDGGYVGFVESEESVPEVLSTYVDPHPQAGPPATVDGSVVSRWATWTDSGGDTALVAQRGHGASRASLLVFGTVSRAQLEQLAGTLTTRRR
ncbi:MAG TPA: DUF4245 family protein [Nocardioides sp.]|uniref:DUF4245 family protein n=1 Tax=Nocardioides sp. TaxID=35761 RepID=UPI002F41B033